MEVEKKTFDVNGYGFMRMVGWAYNYFKRERREGHIAVISSIAGTKPLGTAAAYSATKRMQRRFSVLSRATPMLPVRNLSLQATRISSSR